MPSKELMIIMDKLEHYFTEFHSSTINTRRHPIERFVKFVSDKEPDIPQNILQKYAKTRLFIRIKFLNEKMQVSKKNLKRKFAVHVNKV